MGLPEEHEDVGELFFGGRQPDDLRVEAVAKMIYEADPARSYDWSHPMTWQEAAEEAAPYCETIREKARAYLAAADAVDPLRLGRT